MSTLKICAKWTAVIGAIAASPVLLIFAIPFGCGLASDALGAAGTPAALALTAGVSLAALGWTRYRGHAHAAPAETAAKSAA